MVCVMCQSSACQRSAHQAYLGEKGLYCIPAIQCSASLRSSLLASTSLAPGRQATSLALAPCWVSLMQQATAAATPSPTWLHHIAYIQRMHLLQVVTSVSHNPFSSVHFFFPHSSHIFLLGRVTCHAGAIKIQHVTAWTAATPS